MIIKNKPKPQLCECGCGGYAEPGRRFINGHNRRNIKLSDEVRENIRKSANKRYEDPLERKKLSEKANKRWERSIRT